MPNPIREVPELEHAKHGVWVCPACEATTRRGGDCPACRRAVEDASDE